VVQQAWFLAWTPYALLHGHNPFFTTQLNYPTGVNLASNTLMPLMGLLAAPFTLTIGPVGALIVMLRLSFALSATSMFLVLRIWTKWWPAAFIGGLLYGFSPYMMGQGFGHVNLLFVPFPPLFLALGYELLVRRRWPVRRTGLLAGLVAGLEYLTSSEVLATTALMALIGVALLALRRPTEVRRAVGPVVQAMAWGLLPFVILAGFPIYESFFGPGHLGGPPQPVQVLSSDHSFPLGLVLPSAGQRFARASWVTFAARSGLTGGAENGSYLGLPMVALLVALAIWTRREGVVRFAAVMGAAGFVLSLGPRLLIGTHVTFVRLPYDIVVHLPLLSDEVPDRYSLYLQLFAALIVAVGLDRVWGSLPIHGERQPEPGEVPRVRRAVARGAVVGAVLVVAVVFLAPRLPYPTRPIRVPSYVTDGRLAAVPAGSVVLSYPYPVDPWNAAMLWQADAAMRFSLLGDYAITPQADGDGSLAPPVLAPPTLQELFYAALGNAPNPGAGPATAAGQPPPETPTVMEQLRTFLTRYRVGTILLQSVGYDPSLVVAYLTEALGVGPDRVGGMEVWARVQGDLGVSRLKPRS
jgi:hypothetical protein